MVDWLSEKRKNNIAVSTKGLISYACSLNQKFSDKSLITQLKLVYRFIKRRGITIRRISHIGQTIPDNKNIIAIKFIDEVIKKRKELGIEEDEDYRMVNMDETRLVLEFGFNTMVDFIGIKQINIDTNWREHYLTTVILSVAGDDTKLSPLVILKGEPGKSVKNNSRKLPCVIIKTYIYIAKLMLGVIITYLMNGSLKFYTLSKFIRKKCLH